MSDKKNTPPDEVKEQEVEAKEPELSVEDQIKQERLKRWGVSLAQVDGWKSQFSRLLSVVNGGQLYILRPISRPEYKQMLSQKDTLEMDPVDAKFINEERMVNKALLFPSPGTSDKMTRNAGTYPTLADQLLVFSGFGNDEEPIEL